MSTVGRSMLHGGSVAPPAAAVAGAAAEGGGGKGEQKETRGPGPGATISGICGVGKKGPQKGGGGSSI